MLMKELHITDAELQKLIAPALRKRLKAAGFHTGTASDDNCAFFFPINLSVAGSVKVTRHEDGTWCIQQETSPALSERTDACDGLAFSAIMQRDRPLAKEE